MNGTCSCIEGWLGDDCGTGVCGNGSCMNGACTNGFCVCDSGWEGEACDQEGNYNDIVKTVACILCMDTGYVYGYGSLSSDNVCIINFTLLNEASLGFLCFLSSMANHCFQIAVLTNKCIFSSYTYAFTHNSL